MSARKSIDPLQQPGSPRARRKPFPNAATFLAIALALIGVWLLAGGLPKIMGWPEPSVKIEAGASR